MPREASLARTFVELADTSADDFDITELLTLLTSRCMEVLGVSAAALLLAIPEEDSRVVASSSEAIRLAELFANAEGPCLDSYKAGESVRDDGSCDLEGGFRSVHTMPIRLRGQLLGSLILFRVDAGTLDEADILAAQALADVAAIAIVQRRAFIGAQVVNTQLSDALNSRILIEQAKGILAERSGQDMDRAFAELRNYARSQNLRLADVARGVVDGTTTVPLSRSRPPEVSAIGSFRTKTPSPHRTDGRVLPPCPDAA